MSDSAPKIFTLEDLRGVRRVGPEDFPLSLGGAGADLELWSEAEDHPEAHRRSEPAAYLGLSQGDLFLQGAEGNPLPLAVNGIPLKASHWLHDGDRVSLGPGILNIHRQGGQLRLIATIEAARPKAPPTLVPPPRPGAAAAGAIPPQDAADDAKGPDAKGQPSGGDAKGQPSGGELIQPIAFRPRAGFQAPRRRRWGSPAGLLGLLLLLVLGGAAAWVFTSRPVEISIDPTPDHREIQGGFSLEVGGRTFLRPGRYTLLAEKEGYYPLEEPFEVTKQGKGTASFSLRKLPGRLEISTGALKAEILVDGEAAGRTPLASPLEIAAGERQVRITAPRHQDYVGNITIEGAGKLQTLDVALEPRWAPVSFSSDPSGATVRIDGRSLGTTPLTAELGAGSHRLELSMAGRETRRRSIEVVAKEPLTVPSISLPIAAGHLTLESEPSGATVTVDGTFRGETPLELSVDPNRALEIKISKAGHDTATLKLTVAPRETRRQRVDLPPRVGEVKIETWPADAEVLVDGESRGQGSQTLELPARPHTVEVRRDGYQTYRQTVTPRPGQTHSIKARLESEEELLAKAMPAVLTTPQGHELRLLPSGSLTLGAPRREPGRRANEVERSAQLVRRVYLASQEVSNRQFRRFRKKHLSGKAGDKSLETDHHPVVRVSWDDAVAYCNWLSREEGLAPAYERQEGGRWVLVQPVTLGYRLPTEAEWAWAARYPRGSGPKKYPWGDSLPVAPKSGNYADASAQGIAPSLVPGYSDGFAATAPTDAFGPDAGGFYNFGGNVAEWVNDLYGTGRSGKATDPLGPTEGDHHVIRGSSWRHSTVTELRLTYRDYGSGPRPDVGFRIARYAQ